MSDKFRCAQRGPWDPNTPFLFDKEEFGDDWGTHNTCSYCGSMNPEYVMKRLEAGDVIITPTDKNYKIYLENKGGEEIVVRGAKKFYFQHLNEAQMIRFIELYNKQELHFATPGYFYVLPFFMRLNTP